VDGLTVTDVEQVTGVRGFLDDLRAQLKQGTSGLLPAGERKIPMWVIATSGRPPVPGPGP
jgi:hypothetical protein